MICIFATVQHILVYRLAHKNSKVSHGCISRFVHRHIYNIYCKTNRKRSKWNQVKLSVPVCVTVCVRTADMVWMKIAQVVPPHMDGDLCWVKNKFDQLINSVRFEKNLTQTHASNKIHSNILLSSQMSEFQSHLWLNNIIDSRRHIHGHSNGIRQFTQVEN